MKIEEQFAPFEESKELEELGFDSDCFAWYNYGELVIFGDDNLLDGYAGEDNRPFTPLWQQCWDFFEDKFKLYSSQDNILLDFTVSSADGEIKILKPLHTGEHFKNRQEVRLERLRFLIKTVKEWSNIKNGLKTTN